LRIGVVIKFGSESATILGKEVLEYAESIGISAYLDSSFKDLEWNKRFTVGEDNVDYIVVIGGDGTVLRTLHRLGDKTIPIVTIRHGKRGFLCDVMPFEYRYALNSLISGRFRIVKYMRLEAEVRGRKVPYALNDYVITTTGPWRSKVARIIVYRDDEPIYTLVGDGVIVCPPAGSTAYNLAAGGPVVDPTLEVIIVTPLAPITFCSRSVILPPNTTIKVRLLRDSPPLVLIGDGAVTIELSPGDEVLIRKAPVPAYFVRFKIGEYYVKLFERCM